LVPLFKLVLGPDRGLILSILAVDVTSVVGWEDAYLKAKVFVSQLTPRKWK
jgi:hypothetical protein